MAEWSKAADCKSVSYSRVGSNPTFLIMYLKSKYKKNRFINLDKLTIYKVKNNIIDMYNIRWKNCNVFNTINSILKSNINKLVYNLYIKNANLYIDNNIFFLDLNFKKFKFFPQIKEIKNNKTILNNSLGIISKYFSKKKNYLRSKSSFLLSASYIRKMLIYTSITKLRLNIFRIPIYIKDIMRVITSKSNSLYKHPFTKALVNEKASKFEIHFWYISFINNKSHVKKKFKKKGRLKRKISKKISLLNNILD